METQSQVLKLSKIESIFDIMPAYKNYLVGVDGTVHNGTEKAIGNSVSTLKALMQRGANVVFVSNGTQGVEGYRRKLAKLGFVRGVHYQQVYTSGDFARKRLLYDFWGKTVKTYTIGQRKAGDLAENTFIPVKNLNEAEVLYIGHLDADTDLAALVGELNSAAHKGLDVICLNCNQAFLNVCTGQEELRPGVALKYYLQTIENLMKSARNEEEKKKFGQIKKYLFGKPHLDFIKYIFEQENVCTHIKKINMTNDNTVMIGDLDADIAMACQYEFDSVLVKTGLINHWAEQQDISLEKYFADKGYQPTYVLKSL